MNIGERLNIDTARLDADLQGCWGLPTHLYVGADGLELDLQAIYRKSWLYLCPTEKLAQTGDVVTGFAGDVPVVVTRAEDGGLHGFINACRHRGYKLAEGDSHKCRRLVCKYHAWSYRLNGDLAGAPGSEDDPNFPKRDLGLLPVAVDVWGQGVFINLDTGAPSFADSFPELAAVAAQMGMELAPGRYGFYRECIHDVSSNWKLWNDNFVECYHCNNIHGASFSAAYNSDIASVETHFRDRFMFSHFPPKAAASTTALRANNYRSVNFFPGRVYLQQDDLMIIAQMRPTGPESVQQIVHYFAEEGADPGRVDQWVDLWEKTFTEDGDATAVQQQVIRTGATTRNRLVPSREQAVVRFTGWIYDAYRRCLDTAPARAAAE